MDTRLVPVDAMQTNLSSLKAAAASRDPRAAAATARQLESVFAEQLVKSMRSASGGNSLFPAQNPLYQEMYDRQIAQKLAQGRGLGLAGVVERSLGGSAAPAADGVTARTAVGRAYSLAAYARTLPPQRAMPAQEMPRPADKPDTTAPPVSPTGPAPSASSSANTPFADDASPDRLSPSAGTARYGSPDEFVAAVWPHAVRTAAELGVSPRILVAQAALETGWGRHVPRADDGSGSHNLFGIKAGASWNGERTTTTTQEYADGAMKRTTAQFRAYGDVGASFDDYARLLKSSRRYAGALAAGTDEANFAHALQRAGYATDPAYAAKLVGIANGPALERALKNADDGPLVAAR